MNEPQLSKAATHTLQDCQTPCTFCSRWLGELSTSSESHWLRTQPATIILSRSKKAGCAELLSIKPHCPYSTSLFFSPPYTFWSILSSSISAVQPCGSLLGKKPSIEPGQEYPSLELSSESGMSLYGRVLQQILEIQSHTNLVIESGSGMAGMPDFTAFVNMCTNSLCRVADNLPISHFACWWQHINILLSSSYSV